MGSEGSDQGGSQNLPVRYKGRAMILKVNDQDPNPRSSEIDAHTKGDSGGSSSETNLTQSIPPLGSNLWAEAYNTLKADPEHSRLLVDFKKYLSKDGTAELDADGELLGANGTGEDTKQLELIQKLAKEKLEKLSEAQLSFSIGKKKIVTREAVRKAIKVVSTFKDVVSSAISAEPHAALAWAGVMAILPLLENAYQQDEDAGSGLNNILFLLVRYQEMPGFLSSEIQESHQSENSRELLSSIRSQVVSVYTQVYVYQMRFVLQYARNKIHRVMRNLVTADKWKQMWMDIETTSQRIDQGVQHRVTTRTLDIWKAVDDIKTRDADLKSLQQTVLAAVQTSNEEQLLLSLPFAGNAVFDSAAIVASETPCLNGTQCRILNRIQDWAEDPKGEVVFWLYGMAGTGKTSVALTVANALNGRQPFADEGHPPDNAFFGASFFFKQGDTTRNSTNLLFPTIARCLAEAFPDFKSSIVSSIKENLAIGTKAPQQQLDHLIIKPLSILDEQTFVPIRLVVIIDALDECMEPKQAEELLDMLADLKYLHQVQLRVLITSRHDDHIVRGFQKMPDGLHYPSALEKIELSLARGGEVDDITFYLTHTLHNIAQKYKVPNHSIDIERLSEKANGLFIYAATACRFLDADDFRDDESRHGCLDIIFDDEWESYDEGESKAPQQKVDEIYLKVLSVPGISKRPKRVRDKFYTHTERVLGFIAVLFVPVPVWALTELLGFQKGEVDDVLSRLHSVVYVPQDENASLGFVHLSFRDFLLSEERSRKLPFRVKELSMHQEVFESCLGLMSRDLRQDMCKLLLPGSLASEVSPRHLEENVPHYLRYACRYWIHHLAKLDESQREEVGLKDEGDIHTFLRKSFLYWLETMSLIRETPNAILMINHLQTLIDPDKNPGLASLMYDAGRFVLMNKWIIDHAPLQIYCSALLFCPTASIIRSTFEDLIPSWITQKPNVQKNWTSELSILEGHTVRVTSVAFSPTDDLIVSASLQDGTTRIWDYVTGTERFRFDDSRAICVAFSRDGKMIAYGSKDGAIKVREFATGKVIDLLSHSILTHYIVFSPQNNNIVASASDKGTIRVWDIDKRQQVYIFNLPTSQCYYISFSPDGELLACSSDKHSVSLWRVKTEELVMKFESHSKTATTVAIAADGETVAVGSIRTVRLWNTSGELKRCESYRKSIHQITFSQRDGQLLGIVLDDCIIELRHVDTWKPSREL